MKDRNRFGLREFAKQWGALILVCSGLVGFVSFIDRFETVVASEQKWAEHNRALACKTVADLRAEIRSLETRIEFTNDQQKRDFLLRQIQQIRDEIARIDPKGEC